MSDWRFYSADLLTGTIREELPLQQVTYTDRLKGVQTLKASIPFRHPKATPANLDVETTMLVAARDGVVQFAGPLLDVNLSDNADLLALQCEDLWNIVRRRLLRSTQGMTWGTAPTTRQVVFTGVDQFRIVEDLIDHMQSISGGDLGITVDYVALSGVERDRTYYVGEQNFIGARIEELSNVEDGFDWHLDIGGTVDNITNTLRLHHPFRDRDTGIVLSWDGGTTMLGMSCSWSSRDRSQRVLAVGQGDGDNQITVAEQDPNLLGVLPLVESSIAHVDVASDATLRGHARGELALRKRATVVPAFTLNPDVEPKWGTWVIGDRVRAVVNDGYVQLDGLYRIIGRSISVNENGEETVKMELAEYARFAA